VIAYLSLELLNLLFERLLLRRIECRHRRRRSGQVSELLPQLRGFLLCLLQLLPGHEGAKVSTQGIDLALKILAGLGGSLLLQ
jgi:hypothetical protein